MFSKETYIRRREQLKKSVGKGLILILGNNESPMNYPANVYKFRQDSTFLYYFGLNLPGLNAAIDVETGMDIIFGDDITIDDVVWMGPQPSLKEQAAMAGVEKVKQTKHLEGKLRAEIQKGNKIHFLPPYRMEHFDLFEEILGMNRQNASSHASVDLIRAVIRQREIKSTEEILEIERAHAATYDMHVTGMKMAKPGLFERDVAGTIQGIALKHGGYVSFPPIVSVRGEILHNPFHFNQLKDGDMLLIDSGAETDSGYAADITRTFPVNGKFTSGQKEIYEIVLNAQLAAIDMIKPGIPFREIHLKAASVITDGLKSLGLMKGNTADAVAAGAHALFFPHGLGHMMGMDVHDMEGLGENFVGYDDNIARSSQFGTAYLRLGKELKSGFVLTVEPGIYFIPALIDKWQSGKHHTEFINYATVEKFRNFGGIRIEDDITVTETGRKIIGKMIPKTIAEVENTCQ